MPPLPRAVGWLLLATTVVWVSLEVRQGLRNRPEARQRDRGSRALIGLSSAIVVAAGVFAARRLPALDIGPRDVAGWIGLALVWAGMALRLWSFRTLGRYFTFTVQTSRDQPVVADGPYRVVRHPAYTALLVAALGSGLLIGSWLLVVLFPLGVGAGLAYRIRVEEAALREDLGQAYADYAATRKRLVPFVW